MEKVKKDLGQLLHDKRVSKVNKAYAIYRLDPSEYALNDLLKEVTVLAQKKLRGQTRDIGDVGIEDENDYAQKVTITVWEKLEEFNRSPEEFYPWVATIIMFHGFNLHRDLVSSSTEHVSFTLQDEDGNEYDNPSAYASQVGGAAKLPEGLSEEEELICYLIMDGYKQKRIAELLGIGISTLELKIHNMKARYKGGKLAQSEAVAS